MVKSEEAEYLDIARQLIGRTILSISYSQYYFDGRRDNEGFGDLEILSNPDVVVCFKILNDGECVSAYNTNLEIIPDIEIEGKLCSWKKKQLSNAKHLLGSRLTGIEAMYVRYKNNKNEFLAGWKLMFPNEQFIVYYNCGDDAMVLIDRLPPTDEETLTTWKPIT